MARRAARPKPAVYYAIDPPLVVNFEDGSAVRFLQITMEVMAHDQKAIDSVQKNIPLIRNNLLLLMSNRNYQSMMSREGKEKLRAGGARRDPRRAEEGQAARTSTTCCSPASWCSDGGRRPRRASNAISDEEVSALLEKNAADTRAALRLHGAAHQSHAVAAARGRQQDLRRTRRRVAVRACWAATPACSSPRSESVKSRRPAGRAAGAGEPRGGALQAACRLRVRIASSRACCSTLLDGFFGGSGRGRPPIRRRPSRRPRSAFWRCMLRSFGADLDSRVGAGDTDRAGTREAGDQSAAGAAGRAAGDA